MVLPFCVPLWQSYGLIMQAKFPTVETKSSDLWTQLLHVYESGVF